MITKIPNGFYKVDFWIEDDDLTYNCTCPVGVDYEFCKHCVAVGLAWISEPPPYSPAKDDPNPTLAKSATGKTTMEDVRHYLARQERDTLVRMIIDRAMEDDRWRDC